MAYLVDAADFDGTNDYGTRAGLSSAVDSNKVLFVMWTKKDAGTNQRYFTLEQSSAVRFTVHEQSTFFFVQAFTSGVVNVLNVSSSSVPSTSAWQCFMFSCDLSDTAKRAMYIGDSAESPTWNTYDSGNIDFTTNEAAVGSRASGANKLNGGLAEVLLWSGVYLDITVLSNRRLFISAAGKPVNPNQGAIAALGVPDVYFHLDDGETANNFVANNDEGADGGAFTVTGAFSTYASSPSDGQLDVSDEVTVTESLTMNMLIMPQAVN